MYQGTPVIGDTFMFWPFKRKSKIKTYAVYLRHCGPKVIQQIKAVRASTGLSLQESKELIDTSRASSPCTPTLIFRTKDLTRAGEYVSLASDNGGLAYILEEILITDD